MKKVLLISNYVYHYRINNYDYFYHCFLEEGIEFTVLTNNAQQVDFEYQVPIRIKKPGIISYIRYIRNLNPDCVILFLHLKDLFIFPVVVYCRIMKIPVIYWNFGIDLFEPNNSIKNYLYGRLHRLSNAILLYSPNELNIIKPRYHRKTFIANNTINMTDFENISISGNYLKDHFHIKEQSIILFVGNITTKKRVEELLQCFRNDKKIAVVLVGNAINKEMLKIIDKTSNYYYLGEIYNRITIAKIYHSADIVCIPGNVGLAIVDSFYWGKPLVTVKPPHRLNSPEIWYLKNGRNGYIVNDVQDMERKITELLTDREKYQEFSKNARETALKDAHIDKMYEGFKQAINFLIKS